MIVRRATSRAPGAPQRRTILTRVRPPRREDREPQPDGAGARARPERLDVQIAAKRGPHVAGGATAHRQDERLAVAQRAIGGLSRDQSGRRGRRRAGGAFEREVHAAAGRVPRLPIA